MLAEGDSAPNVTLQMPDGTMRSLSDIRGGKPLLLYFYPKDDTPGCTNEAKGFSESIDAFTKAGVAVLGVSKDSPKKHQNFAAKYGLKIGLATDADGSVTEGFGSWVEKSMYGKKYMGIDRSTFLIDGKGKIVKIWRSVKVPGHVDAALEAAKALP